MWNGRCDRIGRRACRRFLRRISSVGGAGSGKGGWNVVLRFLLALVVIGGLALASFSAPAPTSALSCGPCPAMTLDYLNLRDGPSLNANVLLVMPPRAEISYDASIPAENGYLAVSYGGVDGYAHQLYLRLFPA